MPILINLGELVLKDGNRAAFERQLKRNIAQAFPGKRLRFSELDGSLLTDGLEESPETRSCMEKIFGIANFTFVQETRSDLQAIEQNALALVSRHTFASFRVETKRKDKFFPLDSPQVNEKIGRAIKDKSGAGVSLKNPELTFFVDIAKRSSCLYTEKISGAGGLPVGTSGKTLALLSGGIDSPVAAWSMLKRGSPVDFIHFHSYPQTGRLSIEKVKELVNALRAWGAKSAVCLVPIIEIQKRLFTTLSVSERKYLVLLYRYFMLRLAEIRAKEMGAEALVTGDNLGQVASQTLRNIVTMDELTDASILRPLLSFDKQEIMNLSRRIGTYEISIQPHDDCCTVFVPKHAATAVAPDTIKRLARRIDENLIRKALQNSEDLDI